MEKLSYSTLSNKLHYIVFLYYQITIKKEKIADK